MESFRFITSFAKRWTRRSRIVSRLLLKIRWGTAEKERKHRLFPRCRRSTLAIRSWAYRKLFVVFCNRLHHAMHQCLVEIEHHGECGCVRGFGWKNMSGKDCFIQCGVIWKGFHNKHSTEQPTEATTNRHRHRGRWFLLNRVATLQPMEYHQQYRLLSIQRVGGLLKHSIGCVK